jgi:hypothetical protein
MTTEPRLSHPSMQSVIRPRISRWGATDREVRRALPGDELESPYGYRPISTRAITIDAPPEEVWPWLVQMGSGRAGFYTHEWVERLLFITYADGHSATRIHPEWQELHVGDIELDAETGDVRGSPRREPEVGARSRPEGDVRFRRRGRCHGRRLSARSRTRGRVP